MPTASFESACRRLLEGIVTVDGVPVPYPIEDLPTDQNDNLWGRIETEYKLTLPELGALKNHVREKQRQQHRSNQLSKFKVQKKTKTKTEILPDDDNSAGAAAAATLYGIGNSSSSNNNIDTAADRNDDNDDDDDTSTTNNNTNCVMVDGILIEVDRESSSFQPPGSGTKAAASKRDRSKKNKTDRKVGYVGAKMKRKDFKTWLKGVCSFKHKKDGDLRLENKQNQGLMLLDGQFLYCGVCQQPIPNKNKVGQHLFSDGHQNKLQSLITKNGGETTDENEVTVKC